MSRSARALLVGALHATVMALLAFSLAARADIGPTRLLVSGGQGCDYPAWSPDGTRIAYRQLSGPPSYPALYVANADGSNPRELMPPSPLGGPLAWSPDSSRIAYSWHGSVYAIVILNSDGTDVVRLPRIGGGSYVLAWSPADDRLLYAAHSLDRGPTGPLGLGLYSLRPDGSDPRRVSDENVGQVALLPGGHTIAFEFRGSDSKDGGIRLQPIDGSDPTDLRILGPKGFSPTWSPDGSWIAFMDTQDGKSRIFAVRADGSDRRQVTDADAWDKAPAWSPDGGRIAFVSTRGGLDAIFVVDVSQAFPEVVANAPVLPSAGPRPQPRPDLYVLAVGVTRTAAGASAAPRAALDAADFADACRRQVGGYYGDVVVRELTDREATARAIRHGLLWLRTATGGADTAICLLSGEGLRDQAGDPYIRAYDTDMSRVTSTAVPGSDIDRLMGGIAGKAVVLADLGDPTLLANQGLTDEEARIHDDYAQREVGTPFVLYAVGNPRLQQRRAVHPERRNGVFMEALLNAMAGAGDADANGLLSLNELAAHVQSAVDERWRGVYTFEQFGRSWVDIRLFEIPDVSPAR